MFVGLLVAFLGGYQTAKEMTDPSTVSAEVAPNPATPVSAQTTESLSHGELADMQVAIHAARERLPIYGGGGTRCYR